MAELIHDTADEGFHEIQLSGKQLVFLFMTATIVSVVIFLCGVLVGRGAREARAAVPEATVAEAAGVAPEPVDEAQVVPPPADPPAPAEGAEAVKYPDVLTGKSDRSLTPQPTPKPEPPAASRPEPAPAAAPARTEMPADVPTSGRPGALVVQVFASKDRDVAAALARRLARAGYPAFLTAPDARTVPPYYKVQVGRYNNRREAEDVMRRIQKEEQFKPFITR